MSMKPANSIIKKAQRESLLLREISQLFLEKSLEDTELQNLFINRVELSNDKSTCYVFFYSSLGKEVFDRLFPHLKLYKPSLRKALASRIGGRYVPQIYFKFDDKLKKQLDIEHLIEKVSSENED